MTASKQLRSLLLRVLLGQAQGPDRLYAGLITEFPGTDVSLEFLETIELEVDGYQRQVVRSAEWEIQELDAVATVSFTNNTAGWWRGIAAMFLATSQGAEGLVLTVLPMRFGTHDLPPGGTIRIPITVDM